MVWQTLRTERTYPAATLASLWLGSILVGACADAPAESDRPAPPAAAEIPVFTLERVADGVYATPVRDGVSPSRFALSVIIIRGRDVVVVDSREGGAAAQRLIATIRELTPLPVQVLINTHWHGDHVQGNAAFREAFPGVRIVAGATAAEDVATLGRERLDDEIERVRARLVERSDLLRSGVGEDGEAFGDEDVAGLDEEISRLEAYLTDRGDLELVPPNVSVQTTLDLDDDTPLVRVHRVGPAHTRGDVVVELPELGIVALGDLIEDGFPWFGDGYPAGWASALDRIGRLGATIWLPAHGPVLRDAEMFETQRRFVRTVVDVALAAADRGDSAAEALDGADFSAFEAHFTRRLEGLTDEERRERYAEFVAEVLARAVDEAEGLLDTGAP